MKKFLIIFFSTLGGIFLILIGFFIYFAISISDSTNNTPEEIKLNSYEAGEVFSREMTYAMEGDDIVLDLSPYDLNEILYGAIALFDVPFLEFSGAYIEFKDEMYLVEVPVKSFGISSVLRIQMVPKVSKEGIILKIGDLRLGNFDADSFFVTQIVLNAGARDSIVKSLKDVGVILSISSDLTITMTKDNVIETIENLCIDDNKKLFELLATLALSEDFFSITVSEEGHLMAIIETDGLLYDSSRDGDMEYLLNYSISEAKTLEKLPSITYKEVSAVFAYYTQGYDDLALEYKDIIKKLGYSQSEEGIRDKEETMLDIIKDSSKNLSLKDFLVNQGFTISLTESQLNAVFASMEFIGAGCCFTSGEKIAYLSVEAISFSLENQALVCNFILNMNGKRLILKADGISKDSASLSLEADVKALSIGSYILDDAYIFMLMDYLNSIMKEEDWISCTDSAILLDFDSVINDAGIMAILINQNLSKKVLVREESLQIVLNPA